MLLLVQESGGLSHYLTVTVGHRLDHHFLFIYLFFVVEILALATCTASFHIINQIHFTGT